MAHHRPPSADFLPLLSGRRHPSLHIPPGLYLAEEAKSRLSAIAVWPVPGGSRPRRVAASQFAFLNPVPFRVRPRPQAPTSLRQAGVNMTPEVFLLVMAVLRLAGALLAARWPTRQPSVCAVGIVAARGGCIGRSAGVSTSSTSNFRARSTCWLSALKTATRSTLPPTSWAGAGGATRARVRANL